MSTSVPYLDVRTIANARVIEFSRSDVTDPAYIKQAGEEIDRLVMKLKRPRVVIDFQRVHRLSSAMLGMLVALKQTVEKQDGELRIASVSENIYDIFKLTKLDNVLKICDSPEEAVESFENA
ncbi:MAG: STAS domain-containing protein [Planctomycetota bacterium]|jgi:anti-anti-sigma factor